MSTRLNQNRRPSTGEEGLTILEVLVAMTIFLVVSGTIFGLLKVAQQTRTSVSNNVQLTKSVRLGLNLIGRDTYNAGLAYPLQDNKVLLRDNRITTLVGVPVDVNTDQDRVPPIIAGNNITLNTFNTTPNVRTDQVTFLYKDVSFNLVGTPGREVSQSLNVQALIQSSNLDELQLQQAGAASAKCRVNDLMLISGANSFTLGMVTGINGASNKLLFANADKLGLNNPVNTPYVGELRSISPQTVQRIKMVTYFVTADGILTRREFGNVPPPGAPTLGYVDEPLVYGVEDFQIKYVMDDGTLVDNPSAGPDGIAGNGDDDLTLLVNVRQVRVNITAKTTEYDAQGVPVRATQAANFATRNLGYEAN